MIPEEVIHIFTKAYGDSVLGVERLKNWEDHEVFSVIFEKPMTVGWCTYVIGTDNQYRLVTPEEGMELSNFYNRAID